MNTLVHAPNKCCLKWGARIEPISTLQNDPYPQPRPHPRRPYYSPCPLRSFTNMSLARTIRNARAVGFKEWFRQMTYIGDAKAGRLVGTDQFGNRYFENLDPAHEVPGRHRWIDYSQDDFNASQVPPEWHSWITHIRHLPPTEDPVIAACTPPWLAPYRENITGTRATYKTYSTTAPKIGAWEPKVKPRGAAANSSAANSS